MRFASPSDTYALDRVLSHPSPLWMRNVGLVVMIVCDYFLHAKQVTYAIYATDDVDGDVSGSVTCDPPSGSYMTSGSYQTVTCTASDDSTGHTASPMSFTIVADNSWVDNLGVPADKALTATSGDGAKLTLTLSEFTKPEYAEKINCTSSHLASGSIYTFGTEYTFPVGLTTVTCKSLRYDEFGEWESSKDSFDVLVQDKTAPYMTKTSPTENLISYTIKQASKEVCTWCETLSSKINIWAFLCSILRYLNLTSLSFLYYLGHRG